MMEPKPFLKGSPLFLVLSVKEEGIVNLNEKQRDGHYWLVGLLLWTQLLHY